MDLTVDVIQRVAAEASILSSLQVSRMFPFSGTDMFNAFYLPCVASECSPNIRSMCAASIVSRVFLPCLYWDNLLSQCLCLIGTLFVWLLIGYHPRLWVQLEYFSQTSTFPLGD
jgi:hypothetical protein